MADTDLRVRCPASILEFIVLFFALIVGFRIVSRKGRNCCFHDDRLDIEAPRDTTERTSAHRGGRGTRITSWLPSCNRSHLHKPPANSPVAMAEHIPSWDILPITRMISTIDPGVLPATPSSFPHPAMPGVPPDAHLSRNVSRAK